MTQALRDVSRWADERGITEEGLRREIAYCKARLADIDIAPPGSRHQQGRDRVLRHYRECQRKLRDLQRRRH